MSRGLSRSSVFFGPADMKGCTLDVMWRHQRLQIRTWAAHLEKSATVPFPVEVDTWYRAKLRVDVEGDRGTVRGKVWKKGEAEPEEWTITLEDPIVVKEGAPGIYGDSPTDIDYDDITVKVNE